MMHVDNTEKEPLTCAVYSQNSLKSFCRRPITSFTESGDTPGEGVHNAFYCVEKGHTFSIKCSLLRPPPPGISFGARVYVDSGATNLGAYARAGTDNEVREPLF